MRNERAMWSLECTMENEEWWVPNGRREWYVVRLVWDGIVWWMVSCGNVW